MITIVEPSWEYVVDPRFDDMLHRIELAGRCCYKSEDRITADSAEKFVRMICKRNHVSVLEHESVTVRIVCSRACSHQLVRHRLASYSQESQRYCNYGKKGFQFICPPSVGLQAGEYHKYGHAWFQRKFEGNFLVVEDRQVNWLVAVSEAMTGYEREMETGKPEDARYLLPNASKTEIVVTMNLRMWLHVFKERALNPAAQWEIRGIFKGILEDFAARLPAVFGDLL